MKGNKVLLIVPPLTLEDIYGGLAKVGSVSPPFHLLLLAAVIRKHEYAPYILDCPALGLRYSDVVERISEIKPDIVGITAMTPHVMQMSKLCSIIKKAVPAIKVVVGGVHITVAPAETMQRFPAIDIGILGEGERTIVELLDALSADKGLEDVDGVIFRNGDNIIATNSRKERMRLDDLPPYAWDLLPDFPKSYPPPIFATHRTPAIPIITSRGCPGKCIFCFSGCHRTIGTYPAEYIYEMLLSLKNEYGIREFMVYDDCFVMYKSNLKKLLQRMTDENLDLTWNCNARIDLVDEEMLEMMAAAGCWQISYGIESGNQEIIDNLQKNITKDRIAQAVSLSKKHGIRTVGYFMIGHFRETLDTIEETIQFACSIPLDDIRISYFTPLPGTRASELANRFGTLENDWGKMNLFSPVFFPHGLTKDDLQKKQREALFRFFFRPKIVWSYIKMVRNPIVALKGALVLARYLSSPIFKLISPIRR